MPATKQFRDKIEKIREFAPHFQAIDYHPFRYAYLTCQNGIFNGGELILS